MPRALLNSFGKRQPRALVVGLRRIVKDPKATVAQRLEACRILAVIEGYIDGSQKDRNHVKSEATIRSRDVMSGPADAAEKSNGLRELYECAFPTASRPNCVAIEDE